MGAFPETALIVEQGGWGNTRSTSHMTWEKSTISKEGYEGCVDRLHKNPGTDKSGRS